MRILITGGAGFIGCNLADACIRAGHQVTLFDNLSRRGSEANLAWLRASFGERGFRFIQGDIRDYPAILAAAKGQETVYHLAAQTAVTTSVTDPRNDFEINALGTFNVLEAARNAGHDPVFIFASTNKVYGGMEDAPAAEMETRYILPNYPAGVSEARSLDFHSPYGCSKGAADQYVRDYARIYGLRSVVFRQSCLEGAAVVQTAQGDIPIQDLHGSGQIWSLGNESMLQRRSYEGPFSPPVDGRRLYHLKTARGYAIRATDDHRFYTPGGYLPLADILYGGLVAVAPQARWVQRLDPARLPNDIILDETQVREALADCGRQVAYNEKMIAQLQTQGLLPLRYSHPFIYVIAQLVGYLTGDAHLYSHFKPSRGKVDLGIQVYARAEELEAIADDFRLLGFRPGTTMVSTSRSELLSGHVIEGLSYRFPVYSSAAFGFFKGLGVPVGRKADEVFEMPAWILRAPASVQDAYLRGLFGAEMTAPSFYKRHDDQRPGEFMAPVFAQSKAQSLDANARQFRQQIVCLLADRGVETRSFETSFNYRKGGERSRCYQFNVLAAKDNLTRFARIGYAYNRKRTVQLYRIVEFMQTGLPYQFYEGWVAENTHGLAAAELLWDRVTEKQEVPLQPVYDITVSQSHNFVANGFLVHNCIYGQRQMGVEDQGWVAWFVIAAVTGQPITIYGNGKQVRDLLHVDDLVRAFQVATTRIDVTRGQVYNLGGGPANTLSIWAEFGPLLSELAGREVTPAAWRDWRPGDQPVFVADVSKAQREFGWAPQVGVREGIGRLFDWVRGNRELFA
jgi:nucleoside-diphosphate-sugar epimerase/intein/homing endonuclease